MKFCVANFLSTFLLAFLSTVDASFLRDVAGQRQLHDLRAAKKEAMENALLEKAIPLAEYKAKLNANGFNFVGRGLEDAAGDDAAGDDQQVYAGDEYDDDFYSDGGGANRDDDAYYGDDGNKNNDDYHVQYRRNFDGYSLKYAKCQPVQRFSEEAIEAGEFSPMLTDDIVILRLCPSSSCKANKQYGCTSNYAEYAVGLTDYVRIMLHFKQDRRDQLCTYCQSCFSRRELGGNGNDDANYYGSDGCDDYKTYCYDSETGYSVCNEEGDGSNYFNYLNCEQVKDKDGNAWYIRPRCDGFNQVIEMSVFWDNMCSYHAGDEKTTDDLELGFNDDDFTEFYTDVECMNCNKSNVFPYFYSAYTLCNRMHRAGASCTSTLEDYYLQLNQEDTETCLFLQSMRLGNYDEIGELTHGFGRMRRQVTLGEKVGLGLSVLLVCFLATYASYLHHKITNLVIGPMSNQELLPMKDNIVRKIRTIRKIRSRKGSSSEKKTRTSSRSRSREGGRRKDRR